MNNENEYRILSLLTKRILPINPGGHVTGYFAGGSREGLQRARQTQCFLGLSI